MCSNSMAALQCSCDFEVNQTKIRGSCQSGRKVVPNNSKSDLPSILSYFLKQKLDLSAFCEMVKLKA